MFFINVTFIMFIHDISISKRNKERIVWASQSKAIFVKVFKSAGRDENNKHT